MLYFVTTSYTLPLIHNRPNLYLAKEVDFINTQTWMSFLLFHRFQFCAVFYKVPNFVAKQAWPKLSGEAQWRRLPPVLRGLFWRIPLHAYRYPYGGKENGQLVWLVQTGQRGLPFMFLFCGVSPSLGLSLSWILREPW